MESIRSKELILLPQQRLVVDPADWLRRVLLYGVFHAANDALFSNQPIVILVVMLRYLKHVTHSVSLKLAEVC